MNLRIGAFGRAESAAAVCTAAFASGCFAFDNRALFSDGNLCLPAYAIAAVLSLLLFEALVSAIRRRGGGDLSCLISGSKLRALFAVPLTLSLLLSAMQPQQQCLVTLTQYVFVDARQVSVCFWILPCLMLLSMLGAETLVRTSRLFLPILTVSVAAAVALGASQYRVDRLFPIPTENPMKLLSDTATAMHRAFSPLLMLLCIGEGTQNTKALRSAGRIGAAFGAGTVLTLLIGLSLTFPYSMLAEMPSPFYRLLVEARTENPTLRLDRAMLFLWFGAGLLASAAYLYAAAVLFSKTFGVRDVRPVACGMSALAVVLILVLYHDTETTVQILKRLYRDAWLLCTAPALLVCLPRREGSKCAACC